MILQRITCLLVFCALILWGSAQNMVTQGEYFWDGDPGPGNGTALLATDGNFDKALEQLFQTGIDVSSLNSGAHNFSVRIKGSDGTWSNVFRQTIYIDGPLIAITRPFSITQGEYFWDGDPGLGNGTALLATDGNFNQALESVFQTGIDVSSLSQGAHNFSVRIKGSDGTWSNAFRQTIYIDGPLIAITRQFRLTQGEYFWDTDPGQGNGTPLLATDGNFDAVLENLMQNNIDLSSLSLGPHSFAVRVRGVDGSWSPLFKQTIFVECTSPTVPVVSISQSGTNTCSGTPVQYTATVVNGGTTPTYTWKINGIATGANSPIFTSSTLVNGDILTCDLVSNSTCAGTTNVTSNSIVVSLTPSVLPTINISASYTGSICFGTPVTFNATITNGGSSPLYVWKVNGNIVGSNNSIYSSSALQNEDIVQCELTSNETCAVPSLVTSTGITMDVSNIVTPTISIATSSSSVCVGSNITFTANTSGSGSSPVYQWKVNGNNAGTNVNVFNYTLLNDGDVVTCDLTSSLSCVTVSDVTSNSITMTVSPTVSTEVTITNNTGTTICSGTTVTFTAVPVNGGTPVYQWMLNGLPVGTNSSIYNNAGLINGDIITCNMASSLVCPSPVVASSNSITMTVNNGTIPTASIVSNQGSDICSGTNVVFTASVTNGGSDPVYQWILNGSPVGTNSSTYNNSSLVNGNTVSCLITSNSPCVDGIVATSNTITMSVSDIVTPSIAISASETAICAGMNITFSATAINQGITPTYQWQVNGSNVGTNNNSFNSTTLNNGDIVSCTITSSLNCVTTSSATSNAITIIVTPAVATSVSISSGSGSTICAGTSVAFTATSTNGGTPVYQWMVNGSPVGTNSNIYSTSSLSNGDVVICEMTSSLACPNPAVATSNSITMIVNSVSEPMVSIVSSEGSSICTGTSVTFTATPINGGSSPSYQWMLNGGSVGTNSPTYTNSMLVDNDAISCIMTSDLPCPTTVSATSNTITMTVNPVLPASISINSSATSICSGTSVTFTATSTNGGTPVYQWMVNGAPVGTNSDIYATSSLGNGDVVTCEMASSLACPNPAVATSNSITMIVNSVSEPMVSIVSSEGSSICTGTSVTFTATPTNGGSSPSYQWMLNGLPVGTNNPVYTNSTLSNNDVVNCLITSNLPCLTTVTATSNTITITVNPVLPASISINSSATSICSGTSVTFTATPTNGGTPVYQWMVNGSPVGTNSNAYTTSVLTNGETITCQMTSSLGCATPTTVVSNAITIAVISVNINVTVSNNTLTAIQSGATYQWVDCGNNNAPVFGETEQTFTPVETGMYAVTITSNGCTETSDCFSVNTVGIEQLNQNNWQVYPNPATDKLNVIIETPEVIQITDVSGKIVSVEQLQTGNNTINVSSFAPGVYFIQSKTGREHVKFVKTN